MRKPAARGIDAAPPVFTCMCGSSAGDELTVDVMTGVVLRYRPGINCVVC